MGDGGGGGEGWSQRGSRPLRWTQLSLACRNPKSWQCLGLFLGGILSLLISCFSSRQSQSLARSSHNSFGCRSGTKWPSPASLQCLLRVANSRSHFMAPRPCDLSAHLGGDSCLASTSSVFLSIFGLSYPHLFPWLSTPLNYNFPMSISHCAPGTQNNAIGQSNLCFLMRW